jgi:hypothetical protein
MTYGARNPGGHPATLVASHPGNQSPTKSNAFSRAARPHPERTAEVVAEIMAAPHVAALDVYAANEIAALIALLEAIDRDLVAHGTLRNGGPRKVVELRLRASARLEKWLVEFGLTPRSRAEWARTLAEGNLASEIARRRAAS